MVEKFIVGLCPCAFPGQAEQDLGLNEEGRKHTEEFARKLGQTLSNHERVGIVHGRSRCMKRTADIIQEFVPTWTRFGNDHLSLGTAKMFPDLSHATVQNEATRLFDRNDVVIVVSAPAAIRKLPHGLKEVWPDLRIQPKQDRKNLIVPGKGWFINLRTNQSWVLDLENLPKHRLSAK